MSSTRNEEKTPSIQFFSKPSSIPTPPVGTGAVLTAALPEDVKKTTAGKFSHKLGGVIALTDAIETYLENQRKGKTPRGAGIAAMASFVADVLVESAGEALVTTGLQVAKAGRAFATPAGLAVTAGVLLMTKSKEAADLANLATPLLVDTTLDKFKELKAATLQFVKSAYQKFTKDSALSTSAYPNIETAMVKLDYLQHLKDQGIYTKLDEQQQLLYNWIARETFSDYFQLDVHGKLKPTTSSVEVREIKSNGEEIKLELASVYTSLAEVQKKCQLNPESILGSSTISDKEMGEFFLSQGATPEEVTGLYENPKHVKVAKNAVAHLKEQQKKLSCAIEAEQSLEIINGTQYFFATLAQVGMFARSPALMTVGQIGFHTMQMANSIVRLSSMPIGFASMQPMYMLVTAGLSLISTVLGFGDDNDEIAQRQAQQLQSALYAISLQIEELHTRFDHIEGMLRNLGGMINQVLYNQKIISDQLRETYQLTRTGFYLVQTVLHDMRAEYRDFHDRINSQLTYLIGMTEQDGLKRFGEEAKSRINYIEACATAEDEGDAALARKEFIALQSDIRKACSSHWNGQDKFSDQHSIEAPRDLSLSLQFLIRRLKDKDDGLGFIAEEIEQMTKIPLISAGVKKELLPATSLWSYLVFNYIRLAQLPMFASLHKPAFTKEIQAQADNLLKFIQYLKTNKVIELLLTQHQESINDLQEAILERFTLHKKLLLEDKKSDAKQEKMMRIGDYFSNGEDKALFDKMKHQIDYQYFLLQRLATLTGASPELSHQIALQDRGIDLLTQSYDFNEKPEPQVVGAYNDSLSAGASLTPRRHVYPYMHESLEKFGGLLYGSPGEEKMLFVSTYGYSTDWNGGGYLSFGINQLDLTNGKETNLSTVYTNVTDPKSKYFPRTFPLLEYKDNWHKTCNHTWASFEIAHSSVWFPSPASLVWFSGGSGYVSVFDIHSKQWMTIPGKKPFHVPLDGHLDYDRNRFGGTVPKMTCYTHIINKDYSSAPYLLVNKVEWNKEKENKEEGYKGEAYVRFEICDLQERWLEPDEINTLFNCKVIPSDGWGWVLKGSDTAPTPNQFFIKPIKHYGFSILTQTIIYGLIKPIKDNVELEMHYCEIKPSADKQENLFKPEGLEFINQSLPIALSEVYQTSSENMIVNGKSLLTLVSSVQTKNKKNKLLFINADIYNNHYETSELELPSVHDVPDWQAMRTTTTTIMGKPHLIVTLLDPEYRMMIFSYDPAAKKARRLADGPTLEFIKPDDRMQLRGGDWYLRTRRKLLPGFYPVNTISIQAVQMGGMDTLLISYPKPQYPHSTNYQIQVQRYPLAPALKVKSTKDVMARIESKEEKSLSIPSKLTMSAQLTQRLLQETSERKLEIKGEASNENILLPAYESCKQIHELLSDVIPVLKLSESIKKRIDDDMKKISEILNKSDDLQKSKITLPQLQNVDTILRLINGRLKLDSFYLAGTGVDVNKQLEQLEEEIGGLKKNLASKSFKFVTKKGVFSDGAAILTLRKKLENNINFWSTSRSIFVPQSERLASEAKKWGLTCKDMKHDGNCFFHAIADQLNLRTNNKSETYETLREKAINQLLIKPDTYKNFIDDDFNKFIHKNIQNRTWADDVMITALSRALNVTIVILRSDHASPTIIKQQKPGAVLYIGYEVGSHYQSMQGQSNALKAEIDRVNIDNSSESTISTRRKVS